MGKPLIHIGTSGWYYDHWDKIFYPKGVQTKERLHYYSRFFSTVEINSSFYHLPTEETINHWIDQVPRNFLFSVKASQYITHRKRLNDPEESTRLFFQRIEKLGKKLGPILFQLPPSFKRNEERLREFVSYLPKQFLYVFEFRHPSWFLDETYDFLKKKRIALCITDLNGHLSPIEVTHKFVYIRLHGPKQAYRGSYSPSQLKTWQRRIEGWASQRISTYCYFDNDEKAYAIKDAKKLKKMIFKS